MFGCFICFTGKTLLAKTLARFVNVPFVIADATTLTQASVSYSMILTFWIIAETHGDVCTQPRPFCSDVKA
jgi:ATP-dependent 26S proteasome regulatory subunit